ncbi:BaiN/RdsA family NAD(P)/FAD-dependent oxidoreductase [Granulicella tundricola]|uniref:HI0933 family protein n=1 Tax=Granulicella tundricola (strain ATCC BAA-1859 / DSM 23138 / MP5ACTX9) TaxID=1198114 RepID=E8WVC2_GRATM|nr:NAD(P)/FAD-dependent oxidoreductase [Granulicella tundricola]ADW67297.1 HI0933 family protein [Granulicella tundricola MP5ACTX9]
MRDFDVVVLGAGAAGLMCAAEAGRRGRRVLVVDHADKVGKKILISGGGRCNFTNLGCRAENFISENPHFVRSALARFTAADFVAMVERHGIKYHEKTLGQLFCDASSREIVAMLEKECGEARVTIWTSTSVAKLGRREDGRFLVETSQGAVLAEAVVVGTGGLSIPQMGATSFGYEVAREFGLRVTTCRPGLVPFTLRPEDRERWCDLSGVSAMAEAKATDKKAPGFREKILVTHKGLSGPVVLQISSYWKEGEAVELDLAMGEKVFGGLLQKNARRDVAAVFAAVKTVLPGRWAERWVAVNAPELGDGRRDFTNAEIAEMERTMHEWRVLPAGTEGYAKAEVTTGGVDTAELDAKTMEAKKVPGLYFVGEVVDVTGWLGGYNFQWAWASGFCAGQVA